MHCKTPLFPILWSTVESRYMAVLFIHRGSWQYVEGGSKPQHCVIGNFCWHTLRAVSEGDAVSGFDCIGNVTPPNICGLAVILGPSVQKDCTTGWKQTIIPSALSMYKYLCCIVGTSVRRIVRFGGWRGSSFTIELCEFKGETYSQLAETRSISFRVMGSVGWSDEKKVRWGRAR